MATLTGGAVIFEWPCPYFPGRFPNGLVPPNPLFLYFPFCQNGRQGRVSYDFQFYTLRWQCHFPLQSEVPLSDGTSLNSRNRRCRIIPVFCGYRRECTDSLFH